MSDTPLIYRIRGRRPNLYPQETLAAELLFGADFSEIMMGHLLRVAPDGLVIARSDGTWWETFRQDLREITRDNPGKIVTEKGGIREPLDVIQLWRDVHIEAKALAAFYPVAK